MTHNTSHVNDMVSMEVCGIHVDERMSPRQFNRTAFLDRTRSTLKIAQVGSFGGYLRQQSSRMINKNISRTNTTSFKLVHLFRAFTLYEKKSREKKGANLGALRNLVNSYHAYEDIGEDETQQIIALLEHEDFGLQEMSLLTIRQLCVRENNTFKFLFNDIVPKLLLVLELETTASLHEPAGFALEQVLSHVALKDWWINQMKMGGLASVLNHCSPDSPLPVRYACGCVIRSLVQVKTFAISIIEHAMDVVNCFKSMNSEFQELYTEIISKLLLHADELAASVLNVDALPASVSMLKQGPCGPQQQSLVLISTLAQMPAGLQAVIENKVLALLVSALVNTDCKKVRENAASTIATITGNEKQEVQKEFLLQVDDFYHEQEDRLEEVMAAEGGTGLDGGGKDGGKGGLGVREKIDRAVDDFCKDIVRLIQKEGKMEKDLQGEIVDVHMAPCIDTNATNLNTLCHLLTIVRNLVTFGVGQLKVQLTHLEEEHPALVKEARKRKLPINHKTVKTLIDVKALTFVDLLSVYTQKLLDVISFQEKQKRIGLSTNQMFFQAWESQSTVMSKTGTVYLRSIFDETEIKLVTSLLQTIELISKCSASVNDPYAGEQNETLESKIIDKIQLKETADAVAVKSEEQKASQQKKSKKKHHVKFHSKTACELCNKKSSTETATKSPAIKNTVSLSVADVKKQSNALPKSLNDHAKDDSACQCKNLEDLENVQKAYKEVLQKELAVVARGVRIELFENGIIESVGPWMLSADSVLQSLVLSTLKNMIQPLDEKVMPSPPKERKGKPQRNRPVSEMNAKERDHAMSVALYQMSSRMRQFIQDAVGEDSTAPNNSPREIDQPAPYVPQIYDKFARSPTPVTLAGSRPPSGKVKTRLGEGHGCKDHSFKEDSNHRTGLKRCSSASARPESAASCRQLRSKSRDSQRNLARPVSGRNTTRDNYSSKTSMPDIKQPLRSTSSNSISISRKECQTPYSSQSIIKSDSTSAFSTSSDIHDSGISSASRSRSSEGRHRCRSPTRSAKRLILSTTSERSNSISGPPCAAKRMWVPWKPQLDQTQPIGEQCRSLVAMVVGKVLIRQLFAKDQGNRKKVLNFIDQYIQHGQVGSHLKMSEYGIVPKMVDFLRVNDDDQILEMMGLSVVQGLVKSDTRLKQLFHKHGGTQLLMAMASCCSGVLKEEVADTLKVVSREPSSTKQSVGRKCKSAPARRSKQAPDIWDHIMDRWKEEDKVTTVLQKFAA